MAVDGGGAMAAQDLEEGAKEGKGHRRMETRERNRSEFGMSVGLLFIIFIIRPPWRRLAMALRDGGAREAQQ